MSQNNKEFAETTSPATWDVEQLRKNWLEHLQALASENEAKVPLERLQYQVEQDTIYQEIIKRWPRMDGPERLQALRKLIDCSEKHAREVLPACVRCGECCRNGSPTLHMEDLELLQQNKIPWTGLTTLRRGEPVRSPYEDQAFFLLDERIKIREKSGTHECVLFDDTNNECVVYENRPLQCRAQACWDPEPARQLEKQPYLTRRDLFKDVELLLELLQQHDQRCSFSSLQSAFQKLEESQGKDNEEVIELLAYEEHFRQFLAEQLNIPIDTLELVFGRSFQDLVPLFGFKVHTDADGAKCLVVDRPATAE